MHRVRARVLHAFLEPFGQKVQLSVENSPLFKHLRDPVAAAQFLSEVLLYSRYSRSITAMQYVQQRHQLLADANRKDVDK